MLGAWVRHAQVVCASAENVTETSDGRSFGLKLFTQVAAIPEKRVPVAGISATSLDGSLLHLNLSALGSFSSWED